MLEKAEKVADNTVHINLGNYNQYIALFLVLDARYCPNLPYHKCIQMSSGGVVVVGNNKILLFIYFTLFTSALYILIYIYTILFNVI